MAQLDEQRAALRKHIKSCRIWLDHIERDMNTNPREVISATQLDYFGQSASHVIYTAGRINGAIMQQYGVRCPMDEAPAAEPAATRSTQNES